MQLKASVQKPEMGGRLLIGPRAAIDTATAHVFGGTETKQHRSRLCGVAKVNTETTDRARECGALYEDVTKVQRESGGKSTPHTSDGTEARNPIRDNTWSD